MAVVVIGQKQDVVAVPGPNTGQGRTACLASREEEAGPYADIRDELLTAHLSVAKWT